MKLKFEIAVETIPLIRKKKNELKFIKILYA